MKKIGIIITAIIGTAYLLTLPAMFIMFLITAITGAMIYLSIIAYIALIDLVILVLILTGMGIASLWHDVRQSL